MYIHPIKEKQLNYLKNNKNISRQSVPCLEKCIVNYNHKINFASDMKSTSNVEDYFHVDVKPKWLGTYLLKGTLHDNPFNITVDKTKITGEIGGKEVDINITSNKAVCDTHNIIGSVGNKKISLKRKFGPHHTGENIQGDFGNERINIDRPAKFLRSIEEQINGEGINLTIICKQPKPFEVTGIRKFYGSYDKDPEFLPILLALCHIR